MTMGKSHHVWTSFPHLETNILVGRWSSINPWIFTFKTNGGNTGDTEANTECLYCGKPCLRDLVSVYSLLP